MQTRRGFTLLEMAIVLSIIALLIAGILSGKTIIRQSEIRNVLQEYDRYTKAVKEFQDKYMQLPGDMSTAETSWGTDSDTGVNPCPNNTYKSSATTDTLTCNGDGNGKIGACQDDMTTVACITTSINEIWRVWQHLSNAGLLEGRVTGRRGGSVSTTQATPGLNVPASKFRPGGWTLLHYTNVTTNNWLISDYYGHVFLFGGGKGGKNGVFTTEPIVPVAEAHEMDIKIDDGLPTTGMLRAWDDFWAPTTDNGPVAGTRAAYCIDDATDATYSAPTGNYNDVEYSCALIFIPGI